METTSMTTRLYP